MAEPASRPKKASDLARARDEAQRRLEAAQEEAAARQRLQERIDRLERRVAEQDARLRSLETPQFVPMAPTPAPTWTPRPPPGTPTWQPQPPPGPTRPPADLERQLGANLLAKVGMVVLVLGVVFFLKYAFDQGWITRPMRILLGVVGGTALAVVGDFLRRYDLKRFNAYGQILAGGGAVIVYFSLFASWQFPEYRDSVGLSLEAVSLLMGATAILLAVYASWRRTQVLAMEGAALAALAALFGEEFSGFSVAYTVVWSTAIVAAAILRRWAAVIAVAQAAAYVSLAALVIAEVDPWQVIVGAALLLAIFTAAAFIPIPVRPDLQHLGSVTAAVAFLASWGIVLLALDQTDQGTATVTGLVTAGLAVVALLLALLTRAGTGQRLGWGVAGIILALAWPPIQFDGVTTSIAWALLTGAGALLLNVRSAPLVRMSVLAAGLLTLLHLVGDEAEKLTDDTLDPAIGAIPFLVATVALIVAWVISRRATDTKTEAQLFLGAGLAPPMIYAAAVLDGFAISIVWSVEAIALIVVGFAMNIRELRLAALAVFGIVLIRVFLVDLIVLDLAVRIITFLVVGGLLLLASFLYARRQRPTVAAAPPAVPPP